MSPGNSVAPRTDWSYAATACCFVLSGIAGLLYQTLWSRQYSFVLGTSEAAVSVVLALYMLGLALGAALVPRFMRDSRAGSLRLFGLLELGIACCALILPILLTLVGNAYVSIAGGLPDPPSASGALPRVYFAVSCLLLLIPTLLMGATLPVLARFAVRSAEQTGPRIAVLYAANTLGAAAGALAGGWWLIPSVGLQLTTFVAIFLNLLVTAIAFAIGYRVERTESSQASKPLVTLSVQQPPTTPPRLLPMLALCSGFVALTYEVLWTRMLSHALGSSLAAFSTMLASFLLGIGLGSLLSVGRLSRETAATAYAVSQLGVALCAAAAQLWLGQLQPDLAAGDLATRAIVAMLPATLFMGAAFPLLIRLFADSGVESATATGRIYAFNTIGAVSGAICAGMWMIPFLSFEGTARLAVALSLAAAVAALWSMTKLSLSLKSLASALALIAVLVFRPSLPAAIIDASLIDDSTEGVQRFLAVGRSATVLIKERDDGSFYLRTNGLPEATVRRLGAPTVRHSQRWLAALPIAARPDARSMLVVGLGGGVAIEELPAQFERVDVVELEPQVIAANESLAQLRAHDPLADPRVRLIENDARNALNLTAKKYDIIVSQPSHPWTSGAANLYSQEFLQIAKSRLADGGVLLLWINSQFIDESLLRSISATVLDVFPQVRLYRPEPAELMFIASDTAIEPELLAAQDNSILRREPLYFASAGMNSVEDLAVCLAATDGQLRQLAAGARLVTDNQNLLATRSSPVGGGISLRRLDELFAQDGSTLDRHENAFRRLTLDRSYVGGQMVLLGFAELAARFARFHQDDAAGAYTLAMGFEAAGKATEAASVRELAAQRFPDDADLVFAALRPRLLETAQKLEQQPQQAAMARRLPASARAVIAGWREASEGNWQAVQDLDGRLAESSSTDDWFREAMQLRVEWRTRLDSADRNANLRAALELVDRMIALQPTSDLLILRASAALSLQDQTLFLESASAFASHELRQLRAADEAAEVRDVRSARLRGFTNAIEQRMLPFDEGRASAVLRQLRGVP